MSSSGMEQTAVADVIDHEGMDEKQIPPESSTLNSSISKIDSGVSCELPKTSIKRIMKLNTDVANVSAEAVVATAKVTEDFIQFLIEKSHEIAAASNRKTIKVEDIIALHQIFNTKLEFMEGAFGGVSYGGSINLGGNSYSGIRQSRS